MVIEYQPFNDYQKFNQSPAINSFYHQNDSVTMNCSTPNVRAATSFFIEDLLRTNGTNRNMTPDNSLTNTIDSTVASVSSPSPSSSSSSFKNRRTRTRFTRDQITELEKIFSHTQYMTGGQRTALSKTLGLSEYQVRVWFQNRRIKSRKLASTSTEEVANTYPEMRFYSPESQFNQFNANYRHQSN